MIEESLLDKYCLEITNDNPNMLVPWYIMASYAYYVEDNPIVSDVMFDNMAKKLLKNWKTIDHFHKQYLNEDMLSSGTYLGDYPSRVPAATQETRRIFCGKGATEVPGARSASRKVKELRRKRAKKAAATNNLEGFF